ncbi:MAG: TRAP transporter large permease subunit, partial [Bacilli bacterium]
MLSYLPLILLLILIMLKVPVSFSLIASGLSYFIFVDVSSPADLVIERMFARAVDFPLLAIPFFIIAGSVMNYAGISSRLMDFAEVLTGHLKGGLAQVNVLLSTMMGGITGSASADAAMQCKMLVPEMVKRGYTPEFSAAVTASSAIIPNVIPPGIGLIIYAFLADVSVARMFFAGYLPGLLMCVFLMITISIIANKRGYRQQEK